VALDCSYALALVKLPLTLSPHVGRGGIPDIGIRESRRRCGMFLLPASGEKAVAAG